MNMRHLDATAGPDMAAIRAQFPALEREVHGKLLVYLDSAASMQTPLFVLRAINNFYVHYRANIHRGVHRLSEESTENYEVARQTVQHFLNAASPTEIVFVRGTTEAINLVAYAWGDSHLRPGDEVLVTALEHHANIVPWQRLCQRTGAKLNVVPIDDSGEITIAAFQSSLNARTRLAAFAHVSNAIGTVLPVAEMIAAAQAMNVVTVVDGAQAVPHLAVDVQTLGCDFYAFSGHKLYGPTGSGALYGRRELLESMEPWQTGGDMIRTVSFENTTYNDIPHRFEAGTPDIGGAIGLAAAIQWLGHTGLEAIAHHESRLLHHALALLAEIDGLTVIGAPTTRAAVVSFVIDGLHPHDIGTLLDLEGIAVRTGHHCAMPLMQRLGVPATVRASFAGYNTMGEVEHLAQALYCITQEYRA